MGRKLVLKRYMARYPEVEKRLADVERRSKLDKTLGDDLDAHARRRPRAIGALCAGERSRAIGSPAGRDVRRGAGTSVLATYPDRGSDSRDRSRAHPDDIEFGAGATLAKWAADGCTVGSGAGSTAGRRSALPRARVKSRWRTGAGAVKLIGPSRVGACRTNVVAAAMPIALSVCRDTPMNGHSPRNLVSTKLLTSTALRMMSARSVTAG